MSKSLKFPVYEPKSDGNVFSWLISTAEEFRKLRQYERYLELERLALKKNLESGKDKK